MKVDVFAELNAVLKSAQVKIAPEADIRFADLYEAQKRTNATFPLICVEPPTGIVSVFNAPNNYTVKLNFTVYFLVKDELSGPADQQIAGNKQSRADKYNEMFNLYVNYYRQYLIEQARIGSNDQSTFESVEYQTSQGYVGIKAKFVLDRVLKTC